VFGGGGGGGGLSCSSVNCLPLESSSSLVTMAVSDRPLQQRSLQDMGAGVVNSPFHHGLRGEGGGRAGGEEKNEIYLTLGLVLLSYGLEILKRRNG